MPYPPPPLLPAPPALPPVDKQIVGLDLHSVGLLTQEEQQTNQQLEYTVCRLAQTDRQTDRQTDTQILHASLLQCARSHRPSVTHTACTAAMSPAG
jgi:hypothetical protein